MRLYHLVFALLAACAGAEPRQTVPIGFDSESLLRHRLEGAEEVAVAGQTSGVSGVPVTVTISPEGEVTHARVLRGDNHSGLDPAPAIAAARGWRFRPFTYRGVPVAATGVVELRYRGPELWGDSRAEFPPVDYANLRIELIRSACFGACPDYRVVIDGAGNVTFSTRESSLDGAARAHREFAGRGGVLIPGVHRSRIDRAALDGLIERFRASRFFNLRREYAYGVTDNPTYALTFSSSGRSWTVTDYVGRMAGMPWVVTALEREVDRVAGTARWIDGTEATVTALREEGFDFASPVAVGLAAEATSLNFGPRASDRFVIGLIEAGIPLARTVGEGAQAVPLGEILLLGAVRNHRPALFAFLAQRGWLSRVPSERLSSAFAEGGGGCEPAVARALVAAGADPMARTPRTSDPVEGEGGRATALIVATDAHGPCRDADIGPLIAALVALGVDINAADAKGETALFGVEIPEIQEQLLAAGARADVRDREGNSPAFSSWTDRIVLGLLDAGADPNGRYFDGLSLRRQARERHMPAVLAWLDARDIR